MADASRVKVYHSLGTDYSRAFQVFLDHTDQKAIARDWLTQFVENLPKRRVFLDVGAGNGKVTAWLQPFFQRTIALEPNPALRDELIRNCSPVEVISETIFRARPPARADLVLCSHVFYYLEESQWMAALDQLVSWTAPEGAVVVVLQHHESDGMQMVSHFTGHEINLATLAKRFEDEQGADVAVTIEVVPAHVTTTDFESVYTVAEFILNTLPMPNPPLRSDLEEYIRRHFANPAGGYRLSCTQAFLQIRRK